MLTMDKIGYEMFLEEIIELENKLLQLRKFKGEVAVHEGNAWHDNFTFEQTENEERMLMNELAKRYELLQSIEIVEPGNSTSVEINDIVDIELTIEKETRKIIVKLVSFLSANNNKFKEVTLSSPIGQAIYEKGVDESFSYEVGGKQLSGKVVSITKSKTFAK